MGAGWQCVLHGVPHEHLVTAAWAPCHYYYRNFVETNQHRLLHGVDMVQVGRAYACVFTNVVYQSIGTSFEPRNPPSPVSTVHFGRVRSGGLHSGGACIQEKCSIFGAKPEAWRFNS